jgi:hypothetical protein
MPVAGVIMGRQKRDACEMKGTQACMAHQPAARSPARSESSSSLSCPPGCRPLTLGPPPHTPSQFAQGQAFHLAIIIGGVAVRGGSDGVCLCVFSEQSSQPGLLSSWLEIAFVTPAAGLASLILFDVPLPLVLLCRAKTRRLINLRRIEG